MHGWVPVIAALSSGMVAVERLQPAPADAPRHHARPRLVAETTSAAPGGVINLGVTFEIDPKWHLYWNGRNDSGFPVAVDLKLPEGYAAEPILWPAPRRNLMPGDILDHIYEDRVTLLIPVHVPEDAVPGAEVRITAHLEWMECATKCLLADGDVALSLRVAAGEVEASPDVSLFAEARGRIPIPLPEHPEDVTLSWEDGVLRVEAPGSPYLGFYPAMEGPALLDPVADGESKSGVMHLRFDWPPNHQAPEEARARGVLEVRKGDSTARFYTVDLAPGDTGGATQPAEAPAGIR